MYFFTLASLCFFLDLVRLDALSQHGLEPAAVLHGLQSRVSWLNSINKVKLVRRTYTGGGGGEGVAIVISLLGVARNLFIVFCNVQISFALGLRVRRLSGRGLITTLVRATTLTARRRARVVLGLELHATVKMNVAVSDVDVSDSRGRRSKNARYIWNFLFLRSAVCGLNRGPSALQPSSPVRYL